MGLCVIWGGIELKDVYDKPGIADVSQNKRLPMAFRKLLSRYIKKLLIINKIEF